MQVVQSLQRRFDRKGDDIAPHGGIHIAHHTRCRCSAETASASSQSHTSSRGDSSQFPWTKEGGDPGGMELEDELMFDLDADLEANDMVGQGTGTLRHHSRKLRFPPCLAGVEAYTREIDNSIDYIHLQHDLKRHPFTQAQKGQVCSFFTCQFWICRYAR